MSGGPVRLAVILAAGMGTRLGDAACPGPKGFLGTAAVAAPRPPPGAPAPGLNTFQ